MYGVDFAQYWTRRPMGPPLKNHSKFSKTALWPQNFLRLRRAKRGFAFGTVPHSPELATLTVTIIPVTPDSSSKPRGPLPARCSSPSMDVIPIDEDRRSAAKSGGKTRGRSKRR